MSSRDGWPPQGSNRGNEDTSRPGNGYRSTTPTQQQPILPPPSSSYYQPSASGGPSLPGLSSMDQRSPQGLPPPRPAGETQPAPPVQMQHQAYPLPTMQPAPGQPMPAQGSYDREREMMEAREREARDREQRDRSLREQEMRDQQQREQRTPHQSHAEPPQLHQPVAVGPSRSAMHAPNGILNNNGMSTGNTGPQPASLFGGQYDRPPPAGMQPGQVPIQSMLPFGANPQGVAPGQQPILNDALSYLDQVKVQFSGEPNVYNQFLDIMKDFKSQAIDTPGVIRRVSQLFQGNPNLIQGFNTFLPPGYRIECGTADDPNAIRVTTPMGTTVSPMGTALQPPSERRPDMEGAPMDYEQGGREGNYIQHGSVLSPANRGQALAGYGQAGSRLSPFDPSGRGQDPGVNAALLAHQQEQRGVSQLQNAVSAATGEQGARQPGMSPMPESGTPVNGGLGIQQGAAALEKRGPVEFNHAISYVNKIKNRFSNQPEIYKQFLEILQTYQRESKPIQDVYQQVTHLFQGAQDLLEDFKQFLPESAAHARAQAAKQAAEDATQLSSMREGPYGQHVHPTPRPDRMPPMGNFTTTPSAGRDAKRKRGDRYGLDGTRSSEFVGYSKNYGPNKRAKQQHQLPQQQSSGKAVVQAEPLPVSPTLVPALPEPMPPTTTTAATSEELAFFDKVKKFIGPRSAMNEFLKLCNLYSQDLIDRNLLVKRAETYLGPNHELFSWFKNFVHYDGQDQIIENRARPAVIGRVNLNNCRSLGQSYRQMPKRERNKICSGRDELCRSVLNDEWVSHPTWASEDSGFIAHRKNVHEEGLHRIEEERHDYDLHIASIERTVQILEPLAQQAFTLSEEDKKQWTLPADFGGQTQAIHKKVIAKVYGRERALEIVDELIRSPARVIPVLLTRFRMIAEQWKASQREWDKVWRDQTQRMFWRSLDHQGVSVKASDKRQFQSKTLYQEILVKYEEQKRSRQQGMKNVSKDQLGGLVSDKDVLHDAARLLLIYAEQNHSTDFPRLIPFIKEFIPLFFGMDVASFQARITADFHDSVHEDTEDDDGAASEESSSTNTRGRKANGRKADMRKDVLARNRSTRANKDDATSDSRGTTPEPNTGLVDEEMKDDDVDQAEEEEPTPAASWTRLASQTSAMKKKTPRPDEPYTRSHFNLYANTQIYCFFRLLIILYDRLLNLKNTEKDVHETVKRSKHPKPAIELGMSDKLPDIFFTDTSDDANYYRQVLQLLEQSLKGSGSVDMPYIEDILRRYYLRSGWMLYTFDKLMGSLVRAGIALLGNDNKDRSWDILQLFYKDRKKPTTTHQDELQYRKQVEKFIKEGDLFKIAYDQATSMTIIRILRRDDLSFEADDEAMQTPEDRWRAYVSSYVNLDPTEGVPQEKLRRRFLQRNIDKVLGKAETAAAAATAGTDESTEVRAAELSRFNQIRSHEGLALRISVEEYRIYFDHAEHNTEWWMADPVFRAIKSQPAGNKGADGEGEEHGESGEGEAEGADPKNTDGEGEHQAADRGSEFDEKFIMNSAWMKGMRKDEVDAKNAEFREWKEGTGSSGAAEVAGTEPIAASAA